MKAPGALILVFSFLSTVLTCQAQTPAQERQEKPIFFLDSIRIGPALDLSKIQATDIASILVYKGDDAFRLAGPEASGGVIYIETKKFALGRYWRFFKSQSADYARVVPTQQSDTAVTYILNGKVLPTNFEGTLAAIDSTRLTALKVIDKDQLLKEYGIANKQYGIVITAPERPEPQKVDNP